MRLFFIQVERESHVRQALGDVPCPGLPRTILLGHLELGQQVQELAAGGHTQRHALHGATAVVTELCGEPLLARDAQAYPRLAAAEVELLVRQLMVPLLILQVGTQLGGGGLVVQPGVTECLVHTSRMSHHGQLHGICVWLVEMCP